MELSIANSFFIFSCSWSDKSVEPLSAWTFFAYLTTVIIHITIVNNQSIVPNGRIIPWLGFIPCPFNAATAAPTANGLIVEPNTPAPAPKQIVPTATSESKPAATIAIVITP